MTTSPARAAIFLDRDGTILVERNYLADPAQVELLPGAVEGLRQLAEEGYTLVVVTNQSGIARGMYGEAEYRAVDARMRELLAREGIDIAASYHCPHHPDFSGPCACRKPGRALFERAIRELRLDAAASWLVGDRLRDVEPADALGARGILVRTGYGDDEAALAPEGTPVAYDLSAAATLIVESPGGAGPGAPSA